MFQELLSKISACLRDHNLPYMIIGGQAILLYGEPRLTRDIDITIGVNTDYLDKLLSITRELNLRPIPKDIESFVTQTMVLPAIDESTGIRVDFIFSFTPYETEAIRRAKEVVILGQGVSFATPEDVIIHKIFAGRPRDREDVRRVVVKNPAIDYGYIRKWLKEFDLATEDRGDFSATFEDIVRDIQLQ